MDMGAVNHVDPHLNHESWAAGESFKHSLPYGVEGTVCDDSEYHNVEVTSVAILRGGVLERKNERPGLAVVHFKSDADRELAKQDGRNEGLQ